MGDALQGLPAAREATPGCRVRSGWNSLQFLSWLWHYHLLFLGRRGSQWREASLAMNSQLHKRPPRMGAGSQVRGWGAGPHVCKFTCSSSAGTSECDHGWRYGPERGGQGRRGHRVGPGPVRLASLREEASRAQTCPGRTMRGRRERAAAYVPRSEASGEPAAADPGTEAAQAHGQARPSPPCSASSVTQDGSVNAGLGVVRRPKGNTPFGPAVVGRGRGRGFTRSPGHLLSVGWPQEGRVS